jgi:hypothetical protein
MLISKSASLFQNQRDFSVPPSYFRTINNFYENELFMVGFGVPIFLACHEFSANSKRGIHRNVISQHNYLLKRAAGLR